LPYIPFDTEWTHSIYGFCIAAGFIVSRRLLTPKYLFSLFYNFIYGPLMGVLFKLIGLIMTTIGTSIISAESVVSDRFNYIYPVYNTLKLIGSILPPIQSSPRLMFPKSKSKSNTNKSSSGCHLCKYFACKRQQSKQTIISPDSDYHCSSHIRLTTRSCPSSRPASSPASSAAQCFCPSPSSPPPSSLAPSTTPCSSF
jgi:hypothetical protein